jgi:hypothetical protein
MNSRQYEKMMQEAFTNTLTAENIHNGDYTNVCLSADRTEYEVTMADGTIRIIKSGFDYCED